MNLRWVEEKKKGFLSFPYTPVEIKHLDVVGDICIVWQGAQRHIYQDPSSARKRSRVVS